MNINLKKKKKKELIIYLDKCRVEKVYVMEKA
jgi:hypothetical protein